MTHTGNFAQGQIGTYTVTVSNQSGTEWTGATVLVSFTPPTGWSVLSMGGIGWDGGLRSAVLAPGASYPPITITVSVAGNSPSLVTSQVALSYLVVSGENGTWVSDASASDTTTILGPPVLSISKTHSGSFAQGQTGATYTIAVSNGASAGPSNETVTVGDSLPTGLTLVSANGTGWSCSGGYCTRSDVLNPGSSYPPITVTVNVAPNCPAQVTNQVTVSGSGGLGTTPVVSATVSDVASVVACASGNPAACNAPVVSAILNGASYAGNVAPGTWAAIFGTNLAPSVASAQAVPLPTQLNGVSVTVGSGAGGSYLAPLSYVSPTQINALIPFAVPFTTFGGSVPVVVTSALGAGSPAFLQFVSAEAPSLFTQNGSGTGAALVFDGSFQPVTTVGQNPLILYAAGLGPTNPPASSASGGNSTAPFNSVVNPVDVYVGDTPATVLFAGLAPGLPGIYQLNVQPNGAITDRIYLRSGFWQSNIAQIGVASGNNVSNVTGSIAGLYPPTNNLPSTYAVPGTMSPVTMSVLLLAAVFNVSFDIAPNAQPFDVVATTDAATAVIHFDTQQGDYTATLTLPTLVARSGNFSGYGQPPYSELIFDFLSCGTTGCTQFPGDVIPFARIDPFATWALSYLPAAPNDGNRNANTTVVTTGTFTPGTTFVINGTNHPQLAAFGGFLQIAYAGGKTRTTTFGLYVDGKLIASETGSYNVWQ
jgi:uncharacterized protein (TIGR03437 family)